MEFLTLSRRRSSWRNVPGGEEQGETAVFTGYYNTSPKVAQGIKVFKLTVSFLILTALPASLKRPYKIKNKLLINVNLFCYITVFSPAVTVAGYDEIRVGDAMMKWRECSKTKRYKKKENINILFSSYKQQNEKRAYLNTHSCSVEESDTFLNHKCYLSFLDSQVIFK